MKVAARKLHEWREIWQVECNRVQSITQEWSNVSPEEEQAEMDELAELEDGHLCKASRCFKERTALGVDHTHPRLYGQLSLEGRSAVLDLIKLCERSLLWPSQ
eukprot:6922236-Karenia_brevis.AAC.1